MKGRRRARQLALQALYELDQSQHPVADVLAWRLDDFYRSLLRNQPKGPTPASQVDALMGAADLRRDAAAPFSGLDARELARPRGLDEATLEALLEILVGHQKLGGYAVALVRGVLANREALDKVIARIAPEWPVDQVAPVDRNCLRIALWEIATESAPTRVAINEAVELARKFSGEGARRMVNGALGAFTQSGQTIEIVGHERAG